MEASALRRYIRKEGFSIGLGGDEWRIVGVYLLWFVFSILAYLAMMIAMLAIFIPIGLISGGGDNASGQCGDLAVKTSCLTAQDNRYDSRLNVRRYRTVIRNLYTKTSIQNGWTCNRTLASAWQ